jgi:hypothetical protein
VSDDVAAIRERLLPIERDADDLPWANERRWRAASHVGWDRGVPVVDLHDLSAALARDVVARVLESPPEAGAVVFVHGSGRHSAGTPVLRGVVEKELGRACSARGGWSLRPLGSARMVWIADWSKAPPWVTGRIGWAGWLFAALLVAVLVLAVGRTLGWWG